MRTRTGVILAAALGIGLSGCSGVVKETGVFPPAPMQPPPAERSALPATAKAQPSPDDESASPRRERRLTLPSR